VQLLVLIIQTLGPPEYYSPVGQDVVFLRRSGVFGGIAGATHEAVIRADQALPRCP